MLSALLISSPKFQRRWAGLGCSLLVLSMSSGLVRAEEAVRKPAEAAPATKDREDTISLNVFEVRSDSDSSYGALNSNSITRFNTDLSRMPISADIFTEAFMADIGARTIEDMVMNYVAGAGFDSENNTTVGNTQPGDRNANSNIKLRGLSTPTLQRDAFMPNSGIGTGVSSTFDVERVEVINGPQSLLYGNGGAGGVINTISKQARFGRKPSGSISVRSDEFGNAMGQLDFGAGNKNFAVRVAVTRERVGGRRDNVYGDLNAVYAQFALRAGGTVFRLSAEHADYNRLISGAATTYTAKSATDDVRNGQYLSYLLATNQLAKSATGVSGGGFIGNGKLNWQTLNSYEGDLKAERTIGHFVTLMAESRWNKWLSSEVAVGYRDERRTLRASAGSTMLAPNNATNTTGDWAMTQATSLNDRTTDGPARIKSVRASLIASNLLFKGAVKSDTIVGADFNRRDDASIDYYYYQTDASGQTIINPATASNLEFGRTVLGTPTRLTWAVGDGPKRNPFWQPFATHVSYNGANWAKGLANFSDPALISPSNPLGLRLGGRQYLNRHTINKGIFGANTLSLFNSRLQLLSGFRIAPVYRVQYNQGVATPINGDYQTTALIKKTAASFSVGANYALTSALRVYANVSDSYNPPASQANDPYGAGPKVAHGFGSETGLKLTNATGTLSGTLAYYRTSSKNEQYAITSTLQLAINPTGLNGQYNYSSVWINVDRKSEGVQLALTAAPTKNWRMRFSASETLGTIGTSKSYGQLYNDQFYANSAGQVTYKNGTPVYVLPVFNKATPVVASTATGAIPLTIAMMSDRNNTYYANPAVITGAINSASNVALVLRSSDPVGGPILTGATGLPISAMQINPGFALPGSIPVAVAGEQTVGYPKFNFNFTQMYTFSTGRLKGLRVGGTVTRTWKNAAYYYFPTGVAVGATREIYYRPDLLQFHPVAGYSWKQGRFPVSVQLNVSNVFNTYNVLVMPNPTTGFNGPMIATLDNQPRAYTLSTTVSF
jgi:outer membrane receptor protein involved in Fe transport